MIGKSLSQTFIIKSFMEHLISAGCNTGAVVLESRTRVRVLLNGTLFFHNVLY